MATFRLRAVEPAPVGLTELRAEVRSFLQDELSGRFSPRSDQWMSGVDMEFSRRLAKNGWVGMTIPPEYGGHGRTALERFVVTEELLAAGAPVGGHWIADRQMAPGILRHGTEDQKHRYLPGIASAERIFCIGMSEPDAGSDLAAVRTRARAVDGGWRISGTKVWTSNAHIATNMILLARTDDATKRHEGLSQFIIDLPTDGVDVRPIMTIDGEHHFNEVVLDDVFVPADSLLGVRGRGWGQVTAELANERSGPERILSTAPLLRRFAARAQGIDSELIREDLGRLIGQLVVLRAMSFSVAESLCRGESPGVEAAVVKDLGTTFEREVVETVRRHSVSRPELTSLRETTEATLLRTPAFTLRGGTTEVLRSIVAKGLKTA